jgi:hypothetical protein
MERDAKSCTDIALGFLHRYFQLFDVHLLHRNASCLGKRGPYLFRMLGVFIHGGHFFRARVRIGHCFFRF